MKESPLGHGVAFIQRPSACYAGGVDRTGSRAKGKLFQIVVSNHQKARR